MLEVKWWILRTVSVLLVVGASIGNVFSQDPFSEHIRKTEPLTAQQQLATFKVPDGLKVELVACEPDIQKPLNMAFDWEGKLWVTTTREYPYPAESGQGRDQIVVLADVDGDGTFEDKKVFADDLNIPIGILPYGDGCIVFDIPNISYLSDTDGDGKCDTKKILYGPFDYSRDTHGLNNSFRQGYDGWIYACHGFNNQSKVQGTDGNTVQLNSGNTYRFKPDGNRIEHYSHGQVNPFGMAIDQWFRIYTADCHSKPLTQVVRSGYYPSFGAPSDGLGFAPSMMDHLHGSTAIAGVAFLEGDHWPESLRGNLVSGNVMTCRVNQNHLRFDGSTAVAIEQPDLVETTDPWFRPVDIQIGPDGAIYIADFYNRIIGHYEVPLEHPGRDRLRGRIWRVRPVEAATNASASTHDNGGWTQQLIQLNRACFESRKDGIEQVLDSINGSNDFSVINAMWQAARVSPGLLNVERLSAIADSESALIRTHLMRLLSESLPASDRATKMVAEGTRIAALPVASEKYSGWITDGMRDQDSAVRLAAVDAASRATDAVFLPLLVKISTEEDDPMLVYKARIALKHHLAGADDSAAIWSWVEAEGRLQIERTLLAEVCLAVHQPRAASFVLQQMPALGGSVRFPEYIAYLTRNLPPSKIDQLVKILDPAVSRSKQEVISLLGSLAEGIKRGGGAMPPGVQQWAGRIASELLKEADSTPENWSSFTMDLRGEPQPSRDPWKQQFRNSIDGKPHQLISSILRGEDRVGVLQSREFNIGSRIRFLLAGHRGFPQDEAHSLNKVQLKLFESGEIIKATFPPRNDVAVEVDWETSEWSGQKAVIQLVDGDINDAYAWLAAAEFAILDADGNVEWLEVPTLLPADRCEQLSLVQQLMQQFDLSKVLLEELKAAPETASRRYQLQRLGLRLTAERRDFLASLSAKVSDSRLDGAAFGRWIDFINRWQDTNSAEHAMQIENIATAVSSVEQQILVEAAVSDHAAFQSVLSLAEVGKLNPAVFTIPAVRQAIELKQPDTVAVVDRLTADLPPVDAVWKKTVERRIRQFRAAMTVLDQTGTVAVVDELEVPVAERQAKTRELPEWNSFGKQVFEKSCSVCHQVAGQGQVVGPQLDGIGGRGLDRVLEDVLLPNENVDHAFRSQLFQLVDGRLLTGLVKERDDQSITLVDADGKPMTIDIDDVEAERQSPLSLMPEDVARKLSTEELFGLTQFLLDQKAKPTGEN